MVFASFFVVFVLFGCGGSFEENEFQPQITESLFPCGTRNGTFDAQFYILGGRPAFEGEFPWMVSIQFRTISGRSFHFCGGSLITPNWVLTAAHCTQLLNKIPNENLLIVVGKNQLSTSGFENEVNVSNTFSHDEFNFSSKINDIALIKLATPVKMNGSTTNTLCLPQYEEDILENCYVSGWGKTSTSLDTASSSSDFLQTIDLPIIDLKYCNVNEADFNTVICAGDFDGIKDSRTRDSGGALICQKNSIFYATGIVSTGFSRPGPGLYTKVSSFTLWINSIINNN